jgi:hypothetical protein
MSDNFEDAIAGFVVQLDGAEEAVFVGTVAAVEESIKIGSPITAAPGQPVQSGDLRNSYIPTVHGPREVEISSHLDYALPIEEGIGKHGPLTLRSAVGGFHSIKLTAAGFQRLVDDVVRKVTGRG